MDDSKNPALLQPLPGEDTTTLQQDVYAKQEDLFSASSPEEAE